MQTNVQMVNGKRRFLSALRCEAVDRPPVWLMRQAGRVLPEYRALREKHSFLELVRTPELCAEVTLQPVKRFGFDAAILFSDILVIPEALGQGYHFKEEGGISMEFALSPQDAQAKLHWENLTERLPYVREAIGLVKSRLNDQKALLGFSGSPWTLACFMVEGGHVSTQKPPLALEWFHRDPTGFGRFMERLSQAVKEYLLMQWKEGVDAAQIFDSLSGLIPSTDYWEVSGQYIEKILRELPQEYPLIVYCKGPIWKDFVPTTAQVLSVDWFQSLPEVKAAVGPQRAVQGNLDPNLMTQSPLEVKKVTRSLLQQMHGERGFILNLGHGLMPGSKLECIEALMEENLSTNSK